MQPEVQANCQLMLQTNYAHIPCLHNVIKKYDYKHSNLKLLDAISGEIVPKRLNTVNRRSPACIGKPLHLGVKPVAFFLL
jgi:hypothetical protein